MQVDAFKLSTYKITSGCMDCELCGRKASGRAEVEGTSVSVCDSCARFGKKIFEDKPLVIKDKPKPRSPEEVYFIPNAGYIVKQKRESLGLTREQLAAQIKEKVGVIEHLERGMRPQKFVAEKLEKFLKIRLFSSIESEKASFEKGSSEPLTLGDVATVRKRKK